MNQHFTRQRAMIRRALVISMVLLALLLFLTDPLNQLARGIFLLEMVRIVLLWTLIVSILANLLLLLDTHRQAGNLQSLDLDRPTEAIHAESDLQGLGGRLLLWREHLLFLAEPGVKGADLAEVQAISTYYLSEDPASAILLIQATGQLPVWFTLSNSKEPARFREDLENFLAAVRRRHPHLRLGPEPIASPNLKVWKDVRFVTSFPILIGMILISSLLPISREIPLLSLALTLPAVWYWFRRLRIHQAIGRNGQFLMEMGLFLAALMLQGILGFQDPTRVTPWVLLPVMAVIWIRNLWLKNVMQPPAGVLR